MKPSQRFQITCPDCGGQITVDAATGAILAHRANVKKEAVKDFDSLFADLKESKSRAEEMFERQKDVVRDHDRLMEEKFREALKRAEEDPEVRPPVRPWDLE